jgi:hypothetical protein
MEPIVFYFSYEQRLDFSLMLLLLIDYNYHLEDITPQMRSEPLSYSSYPYRSLN